MDLSLVTEVLAPMSFCEVRSLVVKCCRRTLMVAMALLASLKSRKSCMFPGSGEAWAGGEIPLAVDIL